MHRPLKRRAALSRPLLFAVLALAAALPVHAALNITLAPTASQIIYSPPACGLTLSSAATQNCNSSWRVVTSANASDGTLTTSSGPIDASGGFIPQLFISVRALALSIKTSPASTAIVNVSVSTSNPVISITSQFNSSIQPIAIVGLVEDRLTTVAVTFDPSASPTVLQIDSIIITISDNNTTPFVPPSSPPSTANPSVTKSISIPTPPTSTLTQGRGQSSGDVAAEVLGSLFGLALVAAGAFLVLFFYRKRRRPEPDTHSSLVSPTPVNSPALP